MREIIGNTTTTPMVTPDWEQDNPAKADYIKNKPTILTEEEIVELIQESGAGGGGVQSDWTQTDETKLDYIKNKPTVGDVFKTSIKDGVLVLEQSETICEKGDSAYEVAVKNGFEGTEEEWLASLKGELIDKRSLVGGTKEEWSTADRELDAGRVYMTTIDAFTVRSWLTTGYVAFDIYEHYIDETSKRVAVATVATYTGEKVVVVTDNRNGNVTKVAVRVRPETGTEAIVTFADVTEQHENNERLQNIEKDIEEIGYFFKRTEALADYTGKAIGTTYASCKIQLKNPIEIGQTVTFKIEAPDGDANKMYINLHNGTTNIHNLAIPAASGSRSITYTNNLEQSVTHINAVLVEVKQQNIYTITVYDENSLPDKFDSVSNTVESLASGTAQIPGYYATHLDDAIDRARANMLAAGPQGETFVFISDLHWESNAKNSPVLIGAITDELPIENVIFCGDAINGGAYEDSVANMNDIRKRFEKVSKRFLSLYGNHDSNALDGVVFTNREFYSLLQKQSDYYAVHKNPKYYYYFYMDNPTTKTRMIFLDSGQTNPSYANDEILWLKNTVGNTPEGYNILVFVHIIYTPVSGGSYSDPTTWEMTSFMTEVCTYLDSVTDKTVCGIFGGHSHRDYNAETAGGIPIILIDCDARQTSSGASQVLGTINEQAFDIVTVNYNTNTIHCTRVGRGESRTITQ